MREIAPSDRTDDRRGAARLSDREPVSQYRHVRERAARRLHARSCTNPQLTRTAAPGLRPNVAELPRHAIQLLLAVEHARHALRWPPGVWLRRPVRQAGARRYAARISAGDLDGRDDLRAAAGSERRWVAVLRRLSVEAAARHATRRRRSDRSRPRRCRRGCTSSARPRAISRAFRPAALPRPASRARARPGMLDFDLFSPRHRRSGTRSLGRIDFFNYGEAFLHKRAVEMCE